MAAFQLPFQGAWILKIVQAAVAGGASDCIDIRLKPLEAEICFDLAESWSYQEIEASLLAPQPDSRPSYQHLVLGLRGVAFHERRAFCLQLPEQDEALVWNGENMLRQAVKRRSWNCLLEVSHSGLEECEGEFFSRLLNPKARSENAALTQVLHKRCFLCPVPLKLAQTRLDSFLRNPTHGLSTYSFPYEVSHHDSPNLPAWKLPRSTLEVEDVKSMGFYPDQVKKLWRNP